MPWARRLLAIACLCIAVVAAVSGCGGGGTGPASASPPQVPSGELVVDKMQFLLKDDVVVIADTGRCELERQTPGRELVLSGDVPRFQRGQVINSLLGQGFLGRAQAMRWEGDVLYVQAQPATLQELFRYADIRARYHSPELSARGDLSAPGPAGGVHPALQIPLGTLTAEFKEFELGPIEGQIKTQVTPWMDISVSMESRLLSDLGLTAAPAAWYDDVADWVEDAYDEGSGWVEDNIVAPVVEVIEYVVVTTVDVEMGFDMDNELGLSAPICSMSAEVEKDLKTWWHRPVIIGPMVVTPNTKLSVGAKAEAGVAVTTSLAWDRVSASSKFSWCSTGDFTGPTFDGSQGSPELGFPELGGEATAEAYTAIKTAASIYGATGPYTEFRAYTKAEATSAYPFTELTVQGHYGLTADVGWEVDDFLGVADLNWSVLERNILGPYDLPGFPLEYQLYTPPSGGEPTPYPRVGIVVTESAETAATEAISHDAPGN